MPWNSVGSVISGLHADAADRNNAVSSPAGGLVRTLGGLET